MPKPPATLAKYEPTFEIDDGFRLTREDTLEAVCGDVRRWHAFSSGGADMHLFGAFMCGVSLLRARDLVPKASRGDTVKHYNREGFDVWKRKTFPDISEYALGRYMNFAANVFLRGKELSKSGSVPDLQAGYKQFTCPTTKADAGLLLTALGEVMDGKTMTEMYRSQKKMRQAQIGGDQGNHKARRTAAAMDRERAEQDALENFKFLRQDIDLCLHVKAYELLDDAHVQRLLERLEELHPIITALAEARKLKRLPADWRDTEPKD
jgi:hypothetical protein